MDYLRDKKRRFQQFISLPFIWSLLIPLILLDIWIELYHRICFSLYGLKYVRRSNYIRIDRHKLKYLNWYQKISCAYCGYANGLVHYWSVIAGMTEKYWCSIRHKKYPGFKAPEHHKDFMKYGDEKTFHERYNINKNR